MLVRGDVWHGGVWACGGMSVWVYVGACREGIWLGTSGWLAGCTVGMTMGVAAKCVAAKVAASVDVAVTVVVAVA